MFPEVTTTRRKRPVIIVAKQRRPHLSPRQLQVLQGFADGYSPKEVAVLLGVSKWTVYQYMQRISIKLGTKTQYQTLARAVAYGLVEVAVCPIGGAN